MNDEGYMRRACSLARKAAGSTSPNPLVGALLVKRGRIIAEGYHKKAGLPHAEASALGNAGTDARGSTLYVNLEPCCHRDKRTPPCTDAIIAAGVKKVVLAMEDPNPKVAGKGVQTLNRAGIVTKTGVLEDTARKLNEFYIKYISTGLPFVILKTAMTLDGKIATPEGESKWITSERSRALVHRVRGRVDAVLSAIGTVIADNPLFTSRAKGTQDPVRVIIDPDLRVPEGYNILRCPPRTIIVTRTQGTRPERLRGDGIEFVHYTGQLDLPWLLKVLGKNGITSVLVEGGSSLAAHVLSAGIVDKVMYFIAPKIIGGKESYPAVGGTTFRTMKDALRIRDMTVRKVGDDILIEGYPEKAGY